MGIKGTVRRSLDSNFIHTNIDIDLHRFFIAVRRYGGYNKVCKLRAWTDVYKRLGLPNMISANVSNLKSAYKR